MTCIVGVVGPDGVVYIGGDSAGVGGYDLTVRADEKVFRNGPFAMGFTDSFRMGQLLRYSFVPPEHHPSVDADRYMVTTFIDAVRKCLSAGGYACKKDDVESGGTFLVGYRGRLYQIESDYQVGRNSANYDAVGCGSQIALGSLYATAKQPPLKRIRTALHVAERFSAGVRAPFTIVKTDPRREQP